MLMGLPADDRWNLCKQRNADDRWNLLQCNDACGYIYKDHSNILVSYLNILRGESLLREVIEGRMIGKRPRGRKRLGMLNEVLKKSSYAELKRKAENRKEWRIWKPRTCLTAEH